MLFAILVSESLASFIALEAMCQQESLSPHRTSAVLKASQNVYYQVQQEKINTARQLASTRRYGMFLLPFCLYAYSPIFSGEKVEYSVSFGGRAELLSLNPIPWHHSLQAFSLLVLNLPTAQSVVACFRMSLQAFARICIVPCHCTLQ